MKKKLITSALPYVNNIPHLGNLIQVLSGDVFARFCRAKGYETLYICGTDEYGTATEVKAMQDGVSPRELCNKYHKIHKEIYDWFCIKFDHFGRTSNDTHSKITKDIFTKIYNNGYVLEKTSNQLYSEKSKMFLADRYILGECPHCGYQKARGDQCENCSKLLEPQELIQPKSAIDGSNLVLKETKHLYIDLPKIKDKLEAWIKKTSEKNEWSKNALTMSQGWIRDGLKIRSISRDLKWGIEIPLKGYENKVFYVWFDAPIGYISITAEFTNEWKEWWQNEENVELIQFIGKDNIPFHTVIFPSTLLASGEKWTMLQKISSSEFLNYEGGKFSKSSGTGVFGSDAKESGITADMWRFYMMLNRPETSDYNFSWKDFQESVNAHLIGNFANLVNRTLSFYNNFLNSSTPINLEKNEVNSSIWQEFEKEYIKSATLLESAMLRDALKEILLISSLGNKFFQENQPWVLIKSNEEECKKIIFNLIYLIKDLAILIYPYLPQTAIKIMGFLSLNEKHITHKNINNFNMQIKVSGLEKLFSILEDKEIEKFREKFKGKEENMDEKLSKSEKAKLEDKNLKDEERFTKRVMLVAAKIREIKRHESADKLYILHLDDGSKGRQIVSGLRPYYNEEDLIGKTIILVSNLKPSNFRGERSEGMLLAASCKKDGDELVEVLFLDEVSPGVRILAGDLNGEGELKQIDIDTFFSIPIHTKEHVVFVGENPLMASGKKVLTKKIKEGTVG